MSATALLQACSSSVQRFANWILLVFMQVAAAPILCINQCKNKCPAMKPQHLIVLQISLLTLLLLLLKPAIIQAQLTSEIKGKLISDQQPVPYANVVLFKDTTLITGVVSATDGGFVLPIKEAGTYRIRITAIGYEDFFIPSLQVNRLPYAKDLGLLSIAEAVEQLNAIEVVATKPLMQLSAEGVVVDVERMLMAGGGSALEVLGRSPGVIVDSDGNVSLNGRQGTLILIDGKPTYLSGAELQQFLGGLSADQVKSIALMGNPPARYDAQGTGGVIDIRLKKNSLKGVFGSLHSSGEYNTRLSYGAGGSLNFKQGK